jgi:hypothetical protein
MTSLSLTPYINQSTLTLDIMSNGSSDFDETACLLCYTRFTTFHWRVVLLKDVTKPYNPYFLSLPCSLHGHCNCASLPQHELISARLAAWAWPRTHIRNRNALSDSTRNIFLRLLLLTNACFLFYESTDTCTAHWLHTRSPACRLEAHRAIYYGPLRVELHGPMFSHLLDIYNIA